MNWYACKTSFKRRNYQASIWTRHRPHLRHERPKLRLKDWTRINNSHNERNLKLKLSSKSGICKVFRLWYTLTSNAHDKVLGKKELESLIRTSWIHSSTKTNQIVLTNVSRRLVLRNARSKFLLCLYHKDFKRWWQSSTRAIQWGQLMRVTIMQWGRKSQT